MARYGTQRRRVDPADSPFADRDIKEPMEITSRVSTDDVARAKQRLDAVFGRDAEPVDVALATNMISVGLDILRLGLMVVQGQPKTAAEYIQATSRIGRDHNRPGLVMVVVNLHKPRDRTHFEQFGQFHRSFYRAVEATSVTRWAARALDRALAAVVVAAGRHIDPGLTPDSAVKELKDRPATRAAVRDAIVARAPANVIPGGTAALTKLIDDLLDAWIATADEQSAGGNVFGYAHQRSPHRLLHMPLAPELPNLSPPHQRFVAGRSMRDVEPTVALGPRDENGHLQDIDWKWVVHRGEACHEPMWLEERGTSADPADMTVVCGCGKQESLQTLFQPGRLGTCRAERPWLLDRDPNGCAQKLKLLTRTATNTYFPQVYTVISLPAAEDELTKLVQELSGELANVQSAQDVGAAKRFNSKVSAALGTYSDEDIFARLTRIREGAIADSGRSPKLSEFDVFASGRAEIGENHPATKLHAQTLPRDAWADPNASVDLSPVKNLVAVHRVREVSCLYRFTRFEAAPTSADGDIEDVQLAVRGAPIASDADWLPAEQFGEGLFIHFDENAIAEWLRREPPRIGMTGCSPVMDTGARVLPASRRPIRERPTFSCTACRTR